VSASHKKIFRTVRPEPVEGLVTKENQSMKHTLLTLLTLTIMSAVQAQSTPELTAAEVRRVDAENGKITLKHAEIKSIDMPAMTMVFTAKDKAMLDGLVAGDRVQIAVESVGGKFTVTEIVKTGADVLKSKEK
jgi:Cu/Ag efflux protein CusF